MAAGAIEIGTGGRLGRPVQCVAESAVRSDPVGIADRTHRRPMLNGLVFTVRVTREGGQLVGRCVGVELSRWAAAAELPEIPDDLIDQAVAKALASL
ncbi:MAG: hypothetical protein JWO31_2339 [Phycisphaerales bacterium]|nr:hypothetical protein [Phycisphaerales bacterium]